MIFPNRESGNRRIHRIRTVHRLVGAMLKGGIDSHRNPNNCPISPIYRAAVFGRHGVLAEYWWEEWVGWLEEGVGKSLRMKYLFIHLFCNFRFHFLVLYIEWKTGYNHKIYFCYFSSWFCFHFSTFCFTSRFENMNSIYHHRSKVERSRRSSKMRFETRNPYWHVIGRIPHVVAWHHYLVPDLWLCESRKVRCNLKQWNEWSAQMEWLFLSPWWY